MGEVVRTAHLDLARRLLASTDVGLKVIAKRSGLITAQHLFDGFRRVYHENPAKFRRQDREAGGE